MSSMAQKLGHKPRKKEVNGPFSGDGVTFEAVRAAMRQFALERDWDQFHSPRNIMLAMTGEVGELAEMFQWKGDAGCQPGLPGWSDDDLLHLGQELSDVLLYLLRLADRCGIDLPLAAFDKMELNAAKYPASLAKGSSAKYHAHRTKLRQAAQREQVDGAGADRAADSLTLRASDTKSLQPQPTSRARFAGVCVAGVVGFVALAMWGRR